MTKTMIDSLATEGKDGLLPCPFCGGAGRIYRSGVHWFAVVCEDCGLATRGVQPRERVIALWNTRTLSAKAVKEEMEELMAERDLHYNRCASLLFSGTLDEATIGEIREWVKDYEDARQTTLDLAMMVRRLLAKPVSDERRAAMWDYLKRKGLAGSILRSSSLPGETTEEGK